VSARIALVPDTAESARGERLAVLLESTSLMIG
jgi:hypothetical protein